MMIVLRCSGVVVVVTRGRVVEEVVARVRRSSEGVERVVVVVTVRGSSLDEHRVHLLSVVVNMLSSSGVVNGSSTRAVLSSSRSLSFPLQPRSTAPCQSRELVK